MNRAVLLILFLVSCLTACIKSTDAGEAAYNAQKTKDDKIITDYLAANPTLDAKKIDTSGVYYIIEKPGSGIDLFTNSTSVTVGYTGRLLTTGQVFTQTDDFHPSFILAQVILGWQLGIPKIKKNGTIRLLMPSRYAFGPNAQPQTGVSFGLKDGLPPSAVLDFDITVYDIMN